jgi:alkyldihydroxyacetonephosphate synthase
MFGMHRLARSLSDRLPPETVSTAPDDLAGRGRDLWSLALLRLARGEPGEPPAAVAFPTSTEQVATVLAWAAETGTPVAPRGGGSGVCGAVAAGAGWVVLDLSRMDRILSLDAESRVVGVQAGVRGDRLEASLGEHGLTVGHYPQSIALSTVGGWVAAASAGQASTGYGAIEDVLLGLTAVLAGGQVLRLRPTPRSAAGPDLRRLLVGSEGTLAVLTEAYLACSPRPSGLRWEGFGFDTFPAALAGVREMFRTGAGMAVLRGYDGVDSALTFGALGPPDQSGSCVAIAGFAAGLPGLAERRRAARDAAGAAGGHDLGSGPGAHWWEHRNDAVELYRRIMGPERLFGPGVVVDTMEVAGLWGGLPGLYRAVLAALGRHTETVGCHLSHAYPAGASLYFTFLVRGADDVDAERRYLAGWQDAATGCLAAGGTITHHHGVGRLKAGFLPAELGEPGVQLLRRIKAAADPQWILNPGALLPDPPAR